MSQDADIVKPALPNGCGRCSGWLSGRHCWLVQQCGPVHLFGIALIAACLSGCRSSGNIELLERELREQEDEIYCLENSLQQCHAMLESARRENQALKRDETGSSTSTQSSSTRTRGSASPPSLDLPPDVEGPSIEGGEAEPPKIDAGGPVIEPGVPAGPEDIEAPRAPTSRNRGASYYEAIEPAEHVTDTNVTQIVLVRQLTGGRRQGRRWGDQGITVAIEPKNARGQVVKAEGDVSIVVLDPSKGGAAARVARWDYSADEVLGHYHRIGLTKGMYFQLPWPSAPPENPTLRVFVRFTPIGGQKLEAEMTIKVEPLDREASDWKHGSADFAAQDAPASPGSAALRRLPQISERLRRVRMLPGLRDALDGTADSQPTTLEARAPRGGNWSPYR